MVADLDEVGALGVAAEIGARHRGRAVGVACDVARTEDNVLLVDRATAAFGPVDLFCANAGVGVGTAEQTSEDVWDVAFGVNVRAHVHAARVLVPEWLAVTYGDWGIGVSCLCPMGVDTRLLQDGLGADGGADVAARAVTAAGVVLTPQEVADVVVAALADERFLILPTRRS